MIQIFHFHNGSGGGVLSVIRNLLAFSENKEIENHIIYTINKDKEKSFKLPGLKGAVSEKVFYYSPKWNFYHTCRQLSRYLPNDQAVIVAHDWLELGMASNLGLQNPVVQVLHGDFEYYYDLSQKHINSIDAYICVSNVIKKKLLSVIPERVNDIHFQRFPVPEIKATYSNSDKIKCAYFVRDLKDERKCFKLLPLIQKKLESLNVNIEWHIAGGGMTPKEFFEFWSKTDSSNIFFEGELNNEEIFKFLSKCNIMLLPSLSEGLPVSVVESMKCGLVPLVSRWNGTANDFIQDGKTGFIFDDFDVNGIALCISSLKPSDLHLMRDNILKSINDIFNPYVNTSEYENIFLASSVNQHSKRVTRTYGSFLDKKYFPNIFTKSIRKIIYA